MKILGQNRKIRKPKLEQKRKWLCQLEPKHQCLQCATTMCRSQTLPSCFLSFTHLTTFLQPGCTLCLKSFFSQCLLSHHHNFQPCCFGVKCLSAENGLFGHISVFISSRIPTEAEMIKLSQQYLLFEVANGILISIGEEVKDVVFNVVLLQVVHQVGAIALKKNKNKINSILNLLKKQRAHQGLI